MSWPQWSSVTQPAQPAVPPVLNPATPVINSAPAVVPPGLQYTPDQWAQLQQQNWNQWAQWQQQYQQWHQQYGAEYQKSINALAQAAQQPVAGLPNVAVPPPLPAEVKPPLPVEDPPPPTPSYTTAPPPVQTGGYNTQVPKQNERPPYNKNNQNQNWQAQNRYDNKRGYDHQQGDHDAKRQMLNKSWGNQPQQQAARPPRQENTEELSEAEKKFDKQFAEWEAQFNKWKEQNAEHPDKEQYREYEKKWESWRAQLLERREQMKRKRLGLSTNSPNRPPPSGQGFNQQQSYNSPQQSYGYNQQAQTQRGPNAPKPPPKSGGLLPTPQTNVPFNKPPPNLNDEPLKFKSKAATPVPEVEEPVGDFIKPNTTGGIPGLDLVKDDPKSSKETEDVVVIEGENPESEKKGPDFDAISKGINSILGDQKLLNMLSMVSQNQNAKASDNLTNTVSKIKETSNQDSQIPYHEQSNQSYEDYSNPSESFGHPPREFVNNFDDQTRSSFTMAHNEQETRYDGPGNFGRNQKFDQNQFPNRFGSFNKGRSGGPDNEAFNKNNFSRNDFNDRQFPPRQDNERFPARQDNERFPARQDQDRFPPRQDQDRFLPRQDNERFPPKEGPDRRFPPQGPNQDRFGPKNDRPFGGSKEFNQPPNQERFGANQDWYGPEQNRFGPNQDRFRPNQNRFGPNQDRFAQDQERFGPDHERFGSKQERFGANQDRFGANQDTFGPNQDRFGPNQERFGTNQDRFGANQDRFGANQDRFGANQDRFDSNQERFGPGQDRFAPKQDRFGPGQDRFAPKNDFPPRNEPGFNDRGFGPRGGGNASKRAFGFGGDTFNRGQFDDYEQGPEEYDENYGYDQPESNYGHDNLDLPPEEANLEEPFEGKESYQEPPVVEPAPAPPKPDILQPAAVIDYDHKSLKPAEPEILIEPIYMFDYRHKPLSRIPLPQRPKWLTDTVKNIREFDPPVVRPYEPPNLRRYPSADEPSNLRRYPPPVDNWRKERYSEDHWQPHNRRNYNENRPPFDDRRPPYGDRSYDEPKSFNKDWSPSIDNRRRDEKKSENNKPLFPTSDFGEEKISDTEWPEDEDEFEQPKPNTEFSKFSKNDKPSAKKSATLIEDLINPPGRYKRPPRIVIILRGPPGSGKTFLAKIIKDKEVENGGSTPRILSLDDYFMVEQEKEVTEEGKKVKIKEMVYEYEAEMEESYRTSLIKSFKKTITDGYFSFIIVDNVNDRVKYFGEMWSFAKQNGFQVYICQLDLDVQTCSKRNIHGRSEADIEKCVANWEPTPSHHPVLDATSLLQSASIPEVEMEEVNSPESDANERDASEDEVARSKWDNFDCSVDNLAKLDGVSKPLRHSRTMEEYLQMETVWTPAEPTKPGQKRVRWADLEEQKQQEKMRAIGFVVGHTNWDRMMDPTKGSSALTQTKYIERTGRYKVDQK